MDKSASAELTKTVLQEEEDNGEKNSPLCLLPTTTRSKTGQSMWPQNLEAAAGTLWKKDPKHRELRSEHILSKRHAAPGKVKRSHPAAEEGPLALVLLSMTSSQAAEGVRRWGKGISINGETTDKDKEAKAAIRAPLRSTRATERRLSAVLQEFFDNLVEKRKNESAGWKKKTLEGQAAAVNSSFNKLAIVSRPRKW
ncbi:hypothetical protein JCM11251_003431 [Rhodosporidiobolus azoricus]